MRFAAVALSVFFAATGDTRAAATVGSLDALLERARTASGAPYRVHLVSRSHETHLGRIFEVTTESEGSRYRVRSCAKEICSGSYSDGERTFATNLNDTPLPLPTRVDALQVTLRTIVSYAFTATDFRARGGELVEREQVFHAGRRYRRISVTPARGTTLDALVDPVSGLVRSVVSDERRYVFELDDQRRVDERLTLPFSISLNGSAYERIDSRAIEPLPLAAPAGLVPTIAPDAMPLAMSKPERPTVQPVVPCSIGGQSVRCLLDTGNSGLSMSLELAEQLGLEPQGGAFDISGVGQYITGIVRAGAIQVGPASYPPARYIVLHDLHRYGYDVVLGADAFARTRVTIDYAKREVTFASASSETASGAIALDFDNFIPVVPVRIGEAVVPLAVDTGDESSLNLAYEFYEIHPTLFKANGSMPVAGIGGTSDEITGDAPPVRVGEFEIVRTKIGATKRMPATARGHIGSGLMRHFIVTFDYDRARIELVPQPGDTAVRRKS